MNSTLQAAIDAGVALEAQVVEHAVEPLGYGSDLSCDSDLRENMEEVEGFATLVLAQALYRRLDTPRGSLPDDPDYGFDVAALVNRGIPAGELGQLAGLIRAELAKDDRVDTLAVRVAPTSDGSQLDITIQVTPLDTSLGPFTLTLSATSAAVLLEEIYG